ncbi:ATP-NAD kinase [Atractiella rhizophila]|nr:ATP-NAD kinase [Atractiella rhizophila]
MPLAPIVSPSASLSITSPSVRSPTSALMSPCFVHSRLDNSLAEFLRRQSEREKRRRSSSVKREGGEGTGTEEEEGKSHTPRGAEEVGAGEKIGESELVKLDKKLMENARNLEQLKERYDEYDDADDDGADAEDEEESEEEGHSLTKQLAETAASVREMSKQLGRAKIKSQVNSVMIITKARDNHLIKLTKDLAMYLMLKPRNGRDRGIIVYVDQQLKKSKRFDVPGIQASHPEIFKPVNNRRVSRNSSTTSVNSYRSGSGSNGSSFREGSGDDQEGQLRYWTAEMCTRSAHLFDLVVTLGGDGTVLFASWLFQQVVPPIIPFALGSLGFLTCFDFQNFEKVMDSAVENGIRCNLRMRFTCTVYRAVHGEQNRTRKAIRSGKTGEILMNDLTKGGWEAIEGGSAGLGKSGSKGLKDQEIKCLVTRPEEQFEVINDLVVDRGPSPYVSLLELFGDEHHMTTVQADGLTVSTPTGSTAYSLSAGGSLVHPEIPALLITPICPHTLSFRPMLLPDSMELRICVPYNSRSTAWASFDGRGRVELRQGDHIKVTASQFPFPTVCADKQSTDWFHAISRTLKWNERQRQKSFVVVEEGRKKASPDEDGEEEGKEEDLLEEEERFDIDDISSANDTATSSPAPTPATGPNRVLSPIPMMGHGPKDAVGQAISLDEGQRFKDFAPKPKRLSERHKHGVLSPKSPHHHHHIKHGRDELSPRTPATARARRTTTGALGDDEGEGARVFGVIGRDFDNNNALRIERGRTC